MRLAVPAPRDGVVARVGALAVGHRGTRARRGAADEGRHRSTTRSASLCFAKRGDAVLEGDDLAEVHARDEASAAARRRGRARRVRRSRDEAPPERGILLDVDRLSGAAPRSRRLPGAGSDGA